VRLYARRMKINTPCITVKQTVWLGDADFSVEESMALLHAIFPNCPDIIGMKPPPKIGEFLWSLRAAEVWKTSSERNPATQFT
jgi:hypothetical protein